VLSHELLELLAELFRSGAQGEIHGALLDSASGAAPYPATGSCGSRTRKSVSIDLRGPFVDRRVEKAARTSP
jgi:hypothetical protein